MIMSLEIAVPSLLIQKFLFVIELEVYVYITNITYYMSTCI